MFLDVDTLRLPFTQIAEAYEERLWEKAGFIPSERRRGPEGTESAEQSLK